MELFEAFVPVLFSPRKERHVDQFSPSSVKHELLAVRKAPSYCKSVHCISLASSFWRRMGDNASITKRSESVSMSDLFGDF